MVALSNVELNWIQKVMLGINGYIYLDHRRKSGWKDAIPFYAFKCPTHGIVEEYPHGYNIRLECPKCSKVICILDGARLKIDKKRA